MNPSKKLELTERNVLTLFKQCIDQTKHKANRHKSFSFFCKPETSHSVY